MNQLMNWFAQLFSSWKCWIVIPPWDVGVRVRLGKVAATLAPGIHFRIPGLDEIVLVNTRLRIESTPTVTIKGEGGKARVISATVGYAIVDPVRAMLRYTVPGSALLAMAQSQISEGRGAEAVLAALRVEFIMHGIDVVYVFYTENVEVRTYRLLSGGGGGVWSGSSSGPTAHGVGAY